MDKDQRSIDEEQDDDGDAVGLEVENISTSIADQRALGIIKPFDPARIRVATESKTVSLIVTRLDEGEIDLTPDFQRAKVWDRVRKSRLIESMLLKIPLPVFYVSADDEDKWAVVDGLQRLSAIHDFYNNGFDLSGLEYLSQLEGLNFGQLPRQFQRRINETELLIHIIQSGTPEEAKFNIFHRINTGGMTLSNQEIRHAMNPGRARKLLADLATSESFITATENSIKDTRMGARETVLRFAAFNMTPWEEYSANDLDGFLNEAMRTINRLDNDSINKLCSDFTRSMTMSRLLLGRYAFRKVYDKDAKLNPISKALFETWSVAFSRCQPTQTALLESKKGALLHEFMRTLKSDPDFEVSISSSTGSPQRVQKRFSTVSSIVSDVISS